MKSLTQAVAAVTLLVGAIATGTASAQEKSLGPPTEPWAAQISPREITLVWGAASGATEYRLTGKDFRRSVGQARRYVVPLRGTDTLLQYYVEALDSKGRTSEKVPFNPVVPVTADARLGSPLPPPNSVSAAETSPGEITVNWSPVEGATAYFIGRVVAPSGQHTLCSLCSDATTYVDRDVKAGAEHSYSVAAFTPAGITKKTMSNRITPSGEKGHPPIELRAILSSPTTITLRWEPVFRADRYIISLSKNDQPFTRLATVNKTEYVHAISRGKPTVFRFELLAHVPNKASAVEPVRSNRIVVDSVGDPTTPPSEVAVDSSPKGTVGFRAVRSSLTSITLSWPPVPGATRYVINRSRNDGAFALVATLSKTGYMYPVRPDPKTATVYRFELIARGPKGDAAPPARSEPITVDSTPPPPAVADVPPNGAVGFRAVRSSPTSITLDWHVVPGATRYIIKRSRDDGPFVPEDTLSKTEYVYQVSPDRPAVYRFELVSEGSKGEASRAVRSEPITVDPATASTADGPTVPPKGAIDLRAVLSSPTSITLTWSPVAGATQYTIKESRDDAAFRPIATVSKTEYVVHRRGPAAVFRYELQAEGPKGPAAEPVRSEPITVEADDPRPGGLRPEPRTPTRSVPDDTPAEPE